MELGFPKELAGLGVGLNRLKPQHPVDYYSYTDLGLQLRLIPLTRMPQFLVLNVESLTLSSQ